MGITIYGLNNFQSIFSGNMESYGVHVYENEIKKGKKEEGKNYTKTVRVTEKVYRDHLEGKKGLGIIPIQKDNTCRFSALDIDIYNIDFKLQLEVIANHNIPLFPFRSKSGGLHLYLFLGENVKVLKVKFFMEQFRVLLGLHQNTEIFPKQTSLIKGQSGNWINLPYYNAENTKQFLYNTSGKPAHFEEAIAKINANLQTEKGLIEFFKGLPLSDGPPCLQHIYLFRDTNYRNEYLFSLARYYKTKHGDDFEQYIQDANQLLRKPIENKVELQRTVISSHTKKDYSYRCSEEPIVSVCSKSICRTRQYGIGGLEISQLSYEEFIKFQTDPPYYEWIINGKSLRFFSETEIINQLQFRVLCFRELHILPIKIKDLNWVQIVNRALVNIIIKKIEEADDISPGALFRDYLAEFLERRARAQNKEQILIDRVYKDVSISSYIFKPKNLVNFLFHQKQFRYFRQTEIQDRLRRLGGEPLRYFISNEIKNVRVWKLPIKALTKFIDEETIGNFEVEFKEEYPDEAF